MSLLKTDKMIARKNQHVGWITFNNPARHNALSVDMWEAVPPLLPWYHCQVTPVELSTPAVREILPVPWASNWFWG